MKGEKKKSSVRRFGPRYGATVKNKLAKIESLYKGKQKCPFCNYNQVKRISSGIWGCEKCGAKFSGRAYSIGEPLALAETKKGIAQEEIEDEPLEESEDEDAEEFADEPAEDDYQEKED